MKNTSCGKISLNIKIHNTIKMFNSMEFLTIPLKNMDPMENYIMLKVLLKIMLPLL